MQDIKNILAVSRMTAECKRVIHHGFSLAKKYDAMLHILHVTHDPFMKGGLNLPIPNIKEQYESTRKQTQVEIAKIIKAEKEQGVMAVEHLREGKPLKEILNAIADNDIDLVLLLAHQEGRLEHLLFGLHNDELLRRMPCSIFFIKETYEE